MRRIDQLREEFRGETATARRHLARLPNDRFDWRPHHKSFTVGELGSHLVDCVRWTVEIFSADELELDPVAFAPIHATSTDDLLARYDDEVARAVAAIENADDPDASGAWRLRMRGKVWFEKSREAAFRDMSLRHLVHHRGQLSVYLRLLDVPVPGSYGPTADE